MTIEIDLQFLNKYIVYHNFQITTCTVFKSLSIFVIRFPEYIDFVLINDKKINDLLKATLITGWKYEHNWVHIEYF